MNTHEDYFEVAYLHKGGTIGAMGKKHKTVEEAKDHIEYLINDSEHNKVHAKDRTYYINHVVKTTSIEKVEL